MLKRIYVPFKYLISKLHGTAGHMHSGVDEDGPKIPLSSVSDVDTYVGQAGKVATVKVGEDGIEWAAGGGGGVDETAVMVLCWLLGS